ncbi:MAG TPA: site-2 protease family protein [bacterium]|nr:site-2 protease family protein [bacterium]
MSFITIILVILIISFLVVIHELGHFWASKRNGVRVEEFGVGYPPRLFGKKFGETLYSVNLIPFGGFVKITGEEEDENNDVKPTEFDPHSFSNKTPWQKSQILLAGVFMNTLLSFVLFYIFFFINGFKSFYIPMIFDHKFKYGQEMTYGTVIFDMEEDSPANVAGIKPGEVILKVDGNEIKDVAGLRENLDGKAGEEVEIETMDISDPSGKKINKYSLSPVFSEEGTDTNAIIGVYLGDAKAIYYRSTLEKILSGPMHTYNMLDYSVSSLKNIIGLSFQTKDIEPVASSMTGPVGLFNILAGIIQSKGTGKILNIINTVAIISLGFAFTNALPIPALDGGKVLFRVIEAVTKRDINPKIENKIHNIGMIGLILLVVAITFRDIKIW